MEPPDKDRQLVKYTPHTPQQQQQQQQQPQQQQQQLVPLQPVRPVLTLNLPQQQLQPTHSNIATSPAGGGTAATTPYSNVSASGAPALATTATAISATAQAATAFSGSTVGHHTQPHQHHHSSQQNVSASSSLLGGTSSGSASGSQQQTIEKLSRPMAFDKMEALVREMQDPEHGVPVRQQKMFLTSIPYAFMGYDLIEWLMDRLLIEESEALNIANQLCLHGYFFPVNDTKTLAVKDDSSLYRFQTPYYWPWQHKAPDNADYAIYLVKRNLRNKQRHALEDYENDALASLQVNLKSKWAVITMQAAEQVQLAKERKKGDKIVGDSQERAYWRVHRPPPGQFTPLEPCPIPSRDRLGSKPKRRTLEDVQREVDYLKKSLNRTRMKMSQACESLVTYSETFAEYDCFLHAVLPSNPWVTEDTTFWQLNNTFVDVPTEKRVKRWAISIEELVSDPTGLQEFTAFLEKEYSHENIRFWIAVNRLRRSAHSQVPRKVNEIYEEFLKPGAPCEINIDGKTMESVLKGLNNPSRFTFDSASEHIYMLLLKKDCYPRFVRSDHYKRLLESGIQPSHKKRFFNFGGVGGAKKKMTAALSSQPNLGEGSSAKATVAMMQAPPPGSLSRRRGSDRSLTGSAHELAVIGVNKDSSSKVPHSHSQSNLSEIPYRETPKPKAARLETTIETTSSAVCPWDLPDDTPAPQPKLPTHQVQLSVCPWEQESEPTPAAKSSSQRLTSTSSDISDVSDRMQRNLGIRHQHTVDSGESGAKRLMPNFTEQRRASVSFTPTRLAEYQLGRASTSTKSSTTPSPTVGSHCIVETTFAPLFTPLKASTETAFSGFNVVTKDPLSSSDVEIDEELSKVLKSARNSETSASELPALSPPTSTATPPPITKITPPPPDVITEYVTGESPKVEVVEAVSGTESETEVEVQIELIETGDYNAQSTTPTRLDVSTPTIQVDEACATQDEDENLSEVIEHEQEASQVASGTTKLRSATQSPIKEVATTNSPEQSTGIMSGVRKSLTPPPPPEIGPMEEEAQLQEEEEAFAVQEELSPTTDEYQEGMQFGADSKDVYDYDIVDTDTQAGYIPPAPTPAPSLAPLAVLDLDTVDDELCEEIKPAPTVSAVESHVVPNEEVKKRRKKRNSDGKKMTSVEDKDKDKAGTSASGAAAGTAAEDATKTAEADRNAVCPWEDENTTSDGTFVKTYATLGYL